MNKNDYKLKARDLVASVVPAFQHVRCAPSLEFFENVLVPSVFLRALRRHSVEPLRTAVSQSGLSEGDFKAQVVEGFKVLFKLAKKRGAFVHWGGSESLYHVRSFRGRVLTDYGNLRNSVLERILLGASNLTLLGGDLELRDWEKIRELLPWLAFTERAVLLKVRASVGQGREYVVTKLGYQSSNLDAPFLRDFYSAKLKGVKCWPQNTVQLEGNERVFSSLDPDIGFDRNLRNFRALNSSSEIKGVRGRIDKREDVRRGDVIEAGEWEGLYYPDQLSIGQCTASGNRFYVHTKAPDVFHVMMKDSPRGLWHVGCRKSFLAANPTVRQFPEGDTEEGAQTASSWLVSREQLPQLKDSSSHIQDLKIVMNGAHSLVVRDRRVFEASKRAKVLSLVSAPSNIRRRAKALADAVGAQLTESLEAYPLGDVLHYARHLPEFLLFDSENPPYCVAYCRHHGIYYWRAQGCQACNETSAGAVARWGRGKSPAIYGCIGQDHLIGFEIEKTKIREASGVGHLVGEFPLVACVEVDSSCGIEAKTHVYKLDHGEAKEKFFADVKASRPVTNGEISSDCGGHINLSGPAFTTKSQVRPYMGLFYAMFKKRLKNQYCKIDPWLLGGPESRSGYGDTKYSLVRSHRDRLELRFPSAVRNGGHLLRRFEMCLVLRDAVLSRMGWGDYVKAMRRVLSSVYSAKEWREVVLDGEAFSEAILRESNGPLFARPNLEGLLDVEWAPSDSRAAFGTRPERFGGGFWSSLVRESVEIPPVNPNPPPPRPELTPQELRAWLEGAGLAAEAPAAEAEAPAAPAAPAAEAEAEVPAAEAEAPAAEAEAPAAPAAPAAEAEAEVPAAEAEAPAAEAEAPAAEVVELGSCFRASFTRQRVELAEAAAAAEAARAEVAAEVAAEVPAACDIGF